MPSNLEVRQEREFSKFAARVGLTMLALDELMDAKEFDEVNIREIRVMQNKDGSPGVLAVVKAVVEGRMLVGFSQGMNPSEAIASAVERIKNNSMKWREDRPYQAT